MEFSHFNNNTKSNQLRNNYLTIFQILKLECQLYCGWIKRHSDGFGSCHMILTAHLRVEVEVEDGFGLARSGSSVSCAESAVIIVGKAMKFLPVKRCWCMSETLWKITNFNRH